MLDPLLGDRITEEGCGDCLWVPEALALRAAATGTRPHPDGKLCKGTGWRMAEGVPHNSINFIWRKHRLKYRLNPQWG